MVKEVIPIASDHPGFALKKGIIAYLSQLNFEPLDLGTYSTERVDYPIYAMSVADKVSKGDYKRGIVICKTGVGVSIVANKFPGVRAALVMNKEVAELTRKHNDSNVLALAAGFVSIDVAKELVKIWLLTEPEGGRHQKRIDQILAIEQKNMVMHNSKFKKKALFSSNYNKDKPSIEISASLMCANQLNLLKDVKALIKAGIDSFHVDIIDGLFVQNTSLTVDHVSALRKYTTLPINVHLMVKDPSPYIKRLADVGADLVIIHWESEGWAEKILEDIKSLGMQAGLAVNINTEVEKTYPYIDKVGVLMFMCTQVGFKATPFVPNVLEKMKIFNEHKKKNKLETKIMVDGSVGPRTIPHLCKAGATIFVGGTSGLFKEGKFKQNIKQMKSFTE